MTKISEGYYRYSKWPISPVRVGPILSTSSPTTRRSGSRFKTLFQMLAFSRTLNSQLPLDCLCITSTQDDLQAGHLAWRVKSGYMRSIQQLGAMPELLKRQIDRLETAIDLSTDWLEVQYLMVELDQLKALYNDEESEVA